VTLRKRCGCGSSVILENASLRRSNDGRSSASMDQPKNDRIKQTSPYQAIPDSIASWRSSGYYAAAMGGAFWNSMIHSSVCQSVCLYHGAAAA